MAESKRTTVLGEYDLVAFFPCSWETPWRGSYLITALAEKLRHSKILCVEYPVDLVISLIKHPLRLINKLIRKNHLRKVSDNLFIYRPWILLNVHIASKIPIIQKFNLRLLKIHLDKVLNKNSFRLNSLITWITDPFQEDYLSIENAKWTIYDCYDDYAEDSHDSIFRTKCELLERERRILQKVNLTFVVSETLNDNKRFENNRIHIIPNAVDINHFSQAIKQSTLIADDVRHIPMPIIGFLGNLDNSAIDFTLLDWLVLRNKGWSFVLIGRRGSNKENRQMLKSLGKNDNFYLLGHKPYAQLPRYLKAFDVCLIPFREDDLFSLSCSPLKLYEYLATGKPIVSTNLPGVLPFSSFIRIARSKEEFEKQIKVALQEKAELHEERIKLAGAHSWKKRAEEVIRILEDMVSSRWN